MSKSTHIYIALPILNESYNIETLLDCLRKQDFQNFTIVVCVNQYDSWWGESNRIDVCEDNLKSCELLKIADDLDIQIIDRCSKGNGWPSKRGGVGWARKTIMDYIVNKASTDDIIVSIDADTYYPSDYLQSIFDHFRENNTSGGLAIPYYHQLKNDETDRLILRYEIYMRYYLLNMIRISNPYSFTALGSAMAFPVWAYLKVGGLTPVAAGEDFYFLQKLVKSTSLGLWCSSVAHPSPRLSDRVDFGTGPALIKGNSGDWESYPHYHYRLFDEVKKTYGLFDDLYLNDISTPMDQFLEGQSNKGNIWEPLRNNYKDQKNFMRACANKVDGLRILQFLRKQHSTSEMSDEEIIYDYLVTYYYDKVDSDLLHELEDFSYAGSSIQLLNMLRDFLFHTEMELRKKRI